MSKYHGGVQNPKYWHRPHLLKARLVVQRLPGRRRQQIAILSFARRPADAPVQKDLPDPLPLLLRVHPEVIKIL